MSKAKMQLGFLYLNTANSLIKLNLYTLTENIHRQENFSVKPPLLRHSTNTYGVHTGAGRGSVLREDE